MSSSSSVQRASGAFDDAPVALFVARLPDQEIWMVNDAALELGGRGPGEIAAPPASAADGITTIGVWVCDRPGDEHAVRFAVTLMAAYRNGGQAADAGPHLLVPDTGHVAVGTTDSTSQVGDVACSSGLVLGREIPRPGRTHLLDVVHPADAEPFSDALLRAADERCDAAVTARMLHASGHWVRVHCMFFRGPNAEPDSLGFLLHEPFAGGSPDEPRGRQAPAAAG